MKSFAELARRISAWTTRLLFCALVVLAGWGFGRQVMEWWSAGPDSGGAGEAAQRVPEELAALEPQLVLSDGHWTMAWQGTATSRSEALALLQARCQPLVAGAPLPAGPPGPAERRLLSLLARSTPVAEQPGRWSLYQHEGPLALVVGTRTTGGGDNPRARAAGRRIVIWGVALPHGEQGWATYAFHPVQGRAFQEDGQNQSSQPPPSPSPSGTP